MTFEELKVGEYFTFDNGGGLYLKIENMSGIIGIDSVCFKPIEKSKEMLRIAMEDRGWSFPIPCIMAGLGGISLCNRDGVKICELN